MSLYLVLAASFSFVLFAAIVLLFWIVLDQKKIIDDQQNNLVSYQKALALPFWDPAEVDKNLWARAAQGDEVALSIFSDQLDNQINEIKNT